MARGSLVIGDPNGHGSVLLLVDEFRESLSEAVEYTVGFQDACCGEVGLCNQFYQRRIPSTCVLYGPPVFGKQLHVSTFSLFFSHFGSSGLGISIIQSSKKGEKPHTCGDHVMWPIIGRGGGIEGCD